MLKDHMLAVMADVNGQMVEREELVEAIAVALLTRKNLFVLGEPGQAKSFAIDEFRRRITGARKFKRLLTKQGDEEQLFGRIDLSSLLPGSVPAAVLESDAIYANQRFNLRCLMDSLPGTKDTPEIWEQIRKTTEKLETYRAALAALHRSEPEVQTTGKIPESDIVFLDEIFKANDGVLNALLTALNEREYTNEGRTCQIPTISFFSASNEIPNFSDPEEKILEALYDRLELKVVTENVSERANRLASLRKKQAGMTGGAVAASVTLDELLAMQAEVSAIPVPEAVNELMDDILCELRSKGIKVSDRKYFNYTPIAQAKAWLEGHSEVQPMDLYILRHYLWTLPSDRSVVCATLERMCHDPLAQKLGDLQNMGRECYEAFESATDATAARRIGKLRSEYIRLYGAVIDLRANAQNDREFQQIDELLTILERYSEKAHQTVGYTYAPLEQLYALDKS